MKLSPLQLEAYFLSELTFRANQDFDPDKDPSFDGSDLAVETDIRTVEAEERRWQITLEVKFQPRAEANTPYFFSFTLVGILWVAPGLPDEKLEPLLATNGPSMLYGIAREIARDFTARGPFPALTLPSVSFLSEPPASASKTGGPPQERSAEQP